MINKFNRLISIIRLKNKWKSKASFSITAQIAQNSIFEGYNKIEAHSIFSGELGLGSYIASHSRIEGKIGRFCSIASNVNVIFGIHPYTEPFVSTSPYFYSNRKQNGHSLYNKGIFEEFRYADNEKLYPIIIGNDCWIGSNSLLISGIKIGNGAVVLAGAIVTKDVPPYAIVGGVPAKIIKYRYDSETINFLENTRWWDKDISWLIKNKECMIDLERHKEVLKNSSNG